VFVADIAGRPAGYLACQRVSEIAGQIQLVGVDAAARKRGLGRQLVDCALHWLATEGVTHATVVTQGRNIAAQRLYQQRGFLTSSVHVWYHWWRNR
jgi:ribosomal protein S18 acetylase RimI-like enzyme